MYSIHPFLQRMNLAVEKGGHAIEENGSEGII